MEETARLFNWEEGNSNTIFRSYFFSELLNTISNQDSTPILDSFIPEKRTEIGKEYEVLEVVLKKFPAINDSVSWEQLIDFKSDSDSKRKFLALRNWMIEISKGNYTSMEIGEKLDYLYAEYESHLKRHNLKTNFGVIKTFAITSSEKLEDLVRIKRSKAIKTGFELFEKKSRLTSIESNAPGKEIGYFYDVEQRFKKK